MSDGSERLEAELRARLERDGVDPERERDEKIRAEARERLSDVELPVGEEREEGNADMLLATARGYYFSKQLPRGDQMAAAWLLKTRNVKTNQQEKIFAYSPEIGHYRAEGEALLKADLVKAFGPLANRNRVGETIAKVRALSYCNNDDLDATIPPNLIPLENGIFDLNTGTLLEHGPQYFFTFKHPVRYNPAATCDTFLKFLESSVETEKEREILLDIIALCLYRDRVTRKLYVLVGGGHNGKSLYINTVRELLGRGRVVSLTPQAIEEDVFAAAQLNDKNANMGADIPGGVLRDVAIVKNATGGDTISVQRKGVDREEKKVYCEFVWASNNPPRIGEDTHAIWDRLVVVTFPFTFKKNPQGPTEKLADPDLEKKLTRPEELSGILNLAIKRLHGLVERKSLSVEIDTLEIRKQYRTITDTPSVWVEEACEDVDYIPGDYQASSSGYVTASDAYRCYKVWCEENKATPVSSKRFALAMEALGYERGKDAQVRSYRGLKIKGQVGQVGHVSPILTQDFSNIPIRIGKSVPPVPSVLPEVSSEIPVLVENCGFCKNDVLETIRKTGGGRTDWLQSLYPGEPVLTWLKELSETGEIMELPSGFWRLRE